MHHRKGSFVKGHYREGSWVNSHYRSETTVSDLIDVVKNRAYKHLQDKKSFVIRCWWCEKYVYFFRNENGGCALFEKLGSPWIVHPCWEANYKNSDSELIKEILDKKEHDIVESKVDNYVLYQDINVSVIHESFLIGADFSKRTVINPKDFYSEKSVSFRHFIYLINDKFVELLFPEDSVNILLKEPHLFLKVFSIDKMSRKIFFIHEARLHIDDESFIVDEKNYIENYSRVNWWFHYDLDPLQILLPLQYGSFERCRKKSLDFEDLVIDNIRTAVNMLLDRLMDFYVGNSSLT
ncbi:hypothetical protein DZC41_01570, partial [Acinetobacter haemolyticus]